MLRMIPLPCRNSPSIWQPLTITLLPTRNSMRPNWPTQWVSQQLSTENVLCPLSSWMGKMKRSQRYQMPLHIHTTEVFRIKAKMSSRGTWNVNDTNISCFSRFCQNVCFWYFNLLFKLENVFFRKKQSWGFVFQNQHNYIHVHSHLLDTKHLHYRSMITEAWQYSNIVSICVRQVCILNFNFILCSVPEIYTSPTNIRTCYYTSQNFSCLTIFLSFMY